jgi:hypothetical protein
MATSLLLAIATTLPIIVIVCNVTTRVAIMATISPLEPLLVLPYDEDMNTNYM